MHEAEEGGDGEQTGRSRRRINIREEITEENRAPFPPVSVTVTKRSTKVCEQKSPVIEYCNLPPQPPLDLSAYICRDQTMAPYRRLLNCILISFPS